MSDSVVPAAGGNSSRFALPRRSLPAFGPVITEFVLYRDCSGGAGRGRQVIRIAPYMIGSGDLIALPSSLRRFFCPSAWFCNICWGSQHIPLHGLEQFPDFFRPRPHHPFHFGGAGIAVHRAVRLCAATRRAVALVDVLPQPAGRLSMAAIPALAQPDKLVIGATRCESRHQFQLLDRGDTQPPRKAPSIRPLF